MDSDTVRAGTWDIEDDPLDKDPIVRAHWMLIADARRKLKKGQRRLLENACRMIDEKPDDFVPNWWTQRANNDTWYLITGDEDGRDGSEAWHWQDYNPDR